MAERFSFEVGLGGSRRQQARSHGDDRSLRILVLGDFGGLRDRGDLATRPFLSVDVDTFSAALQRLAPRLALPSALRTQAAESQVFVEFSALDHFHPDHLYRSLDAFAPLRRSRARLLDPATFEGEAAELLTAAAPGAVAASPAAAAAASGVATEAQAESRDGVMERLLGSRPASVQSGARRPQGLPERLLRDLVEPYVVRGRPEGPAPYVDALDAEATERMRRLLHDPGFHELEASWRGLRWLIDSIEDADGLRIQLLDVTKQELIEDVDASAGRFEESALYRRLVPGEGRALDDLPCSLIVGNFRFGARASDLALLARLGAVGSLIGAPFLAAAEPGFVGCGELADMAEPQSWRIPDPEIEHRLATLRASVVAPWIGLGMPRFLLRLPYGADTDPVEAFQFTELTGTGDPADYLWGNPAFAVALVAARTILADDSPFRGDTLEIVDLPAHVTRHYGESRLLPCAECLVGSDLAETLRERGVMPLLAYRQRNAVRLGGLHSLAAELAPLAGLPA